MTAPTLTPPPVDAWTRTLALLVLAAADPAVLAVLAPEHVAPGAPRQLLRALQARPVLADALGPEAVAVATGGDVWLAGLVESLATRDSWTGRVLQLMGRRVLAELPAAGAPRAPRETHADFEAAVAAAAARRAGAAA